MLSGSEAARSTNPGAKNGKNGCTMREFPNQDSIKLIFTGSGPAASNSKQVIVSLDPSKDNFLRKALNTNPTLTNTSITDADTRATYFGAGSNTYWLGESFEYSLAASGSDSIGVLGEALGSNKVYAAIIPMAESAATMTKYQSDFEGAAIRASTGWFIAQDLTTDNATYYSRDQQKLFRLEALTAGDDAQRRVKISISNIKAPTGKYQKYGTFSVLVREIGDTDNLPVIIERWDELNLNPASPNYIAAQIGDKYQVYDKPTERNIEYGEFDNRSNYIRVVMNDTVAQGGGEPRWLPFGVWGPPKYRDVGYASGSAGWSANTDTVAVASKGATLTMLQGSGSQTFGEAGHDDALGNIMLDVGKSDVGDPAFFVINNPSIPLRQKSTWGSPKSLKRTFWGGWSGRTNTDTFLNPSVHDMLRPRNFDVQSAGESANPAATYDVSEDKQTTNAGSSAIVSSWVFSLDNIGYVSGVNANNGYLYKHDSRRGGESISASGSYTDTLSAGIDRFTTFLHGGFDGFNIQEADPFNQTAMTATDEDDSYALFTLKKAVNIASDSDYVQMNIISMPGIWRPAVTNKILDIAEDRGDALAVIDIQYGWTPAAEGTGTNQSRNTGNTATAAANEVASRSINNSYGATYYPWVRIVDTNTNRTLWAPPSVAALGVLSTTDRIQAPWFAPAGFTRGGLSEGAAGIPVVDVARRLTADDRDNLYENNINPIAKFPAEGIVVFGQKTLQQTASALDRINVRRLMIFLKREISFIASRLLFGPNAKVTWDRFLGQANPLLESVQAEFGIDEFRLVLDETTTTPDLIDRNIIYAKLLVKPTKAVEFFAIDFVVTNDGAAFED